MKNFTLLFTAILFAFSANAQFTLDAGTNLIDFSNPDDLWANYAADPGSYTTGGIGVFKYDETNDEDVESTLDTDYSVIDGISDKAISLTANNWIEIWHGIPANGDGGWVNDWSVVMDIRISDATKTIALLEVNPNAGGTDDFAPEFEIEAGKIGTNQEDLGFSTNTLETEKWYRVTYTANLDDAVRFYVDGEEWHAVEDYSNLDGLPAPYNADTRQENAIFRFGGIATPDLDYDIDIDLIAIFSAELTAQEVADLGAAQVGSSVHEFMQEYNSIRVYPNPASNIINIESKNAVSYQVMNAIGQVVTEGAVKANLTTVNISDYRTGMYFVKVVSDNGKSTIKKVIVK